LTPIRGREYNLLVAGGVSFEPEAWGFLRVTKKEIPIPEPGLYQIVADGIHAHAEQNQMVRRMSTPVDQV